MRSGCSVNPVRREDGMMKKVVGFLMMVACVSGFFSRADAVDMTYRLYPGDILEISVWKDESLSREVIVPPDGMISFPLIGDIRVRDLTIADLRAVVEKKLTEYVPDATVTVMLLRVNSLTAYVIGKVNKPGQFPIDLETNVMQVLAMAGGPNPYAAEAKILILRQVDGKTTKIPFNYKDVEKGEHLEQNIILQRGDVVVVP
jgi:polysaccharide export outer membrane protein